MLKAMEKLYQSIPLELSKFQSFTVCGLTCQVYTCTVRAPFLSSVSSPLLPVNCGSTALWCLVKSGLTRIKTRENRLVHVGLSDALVLCCVRWHIQVNGQNCFVLKICARKELLNFLCASISAASAEEGSDLFNQLSAGVIFCHVESGDRYCVIIFWTTKTLVGSIFPQISCVLFGSSDF